MTSCNEILPETGENRPQARFSVSIHANPFLGAMKNPSLSLHCLTRLSCSHWAFQMS